ncbi:MAG: hypothetical protein ABIP97_11155 [Chthoniobacterales bacterium]
MLPIGNGFCKYAGRMNTALLRLSLFPVLALTFIASVHAQSPTAEQLKSWVAIRQERVNLLRDEIKQTDTRIESRIDIILDELKSITDSHDSHSNVAQMKDETGRQLLKTIDYYDRKRAALKEELRNPRLHITAKEKKGMIDVFDSRIEKRAQQLLALYKSMPVYEEHAQYQVAGSGWNGTEYTRNKSYDQNYRMTLRSKQQRDALMKQLDASIARLDRQSRTLKTQRNATTDPLQRKTLSEEIAKNDTLIAERRKQRVEVVKPPVGSNGRKVALIEATDINKAIQSASADLKKEVTTLFGHYNTLLNDLSTLHATEAALAAKTAH